MDSKTLIYNRVLIHLGIAGKIQHFNENSVEAITISNNYDLARDFILKDFDWNFSQTFKELSLSDNMTNINPSGYLYQYHYPDDCISARSVYALGSKDEKEFKIASDEKGQTVILTNVCPAVLRYTKRIEQEKLFTSEFEAALSLYLAYLSAEALTGSENKTDRLLQKYELFKRRFEKINADEGRNDDEDNSTFIDARYN